MAANRYDMQKKEIEQTTKFADTAAQKRNDATNAYTNSLDDVYGAAIKNQEQATDYQIQATNQDYQIGYDNAAIQAEINKRQVANAMANAGLTNSGLNRTQQTAIQTARTNQENALTQQKTAAVSSLRQQLNDYKAQINSQVAQAKADAIYNSNMQNANSYENWMATGYQQGNANFENDRTFAEQQRQHDDQMAFNREQIAAANYQAELESEAAKDSTLAQIRADNLANMNKSLQSMRDNRYDSYGNFKDYSEAELESLREQIYYAYKSYGLSDAEASALAISAGINPVAYEEWAEKKEKGLDQDIVPGKTTVKSTSKVTNKGSKNAVKTINNNSKSSASNKTSNNF